MSAFLSKAFTIAFFKSTGISPDSKLQFTKVVIAGVKESAHSIINHVGTASKEYIFLDKFLRILFTSASVTGSKLPSP